MLILMALGTVAVIAQQDTGWTSSGEQCFSYAGVEYTHTTTSSGAGKITVIENHNTYAVTILYTGTGSQQSLWIAAGGKKTVDGHITINSCTKN